MKWKILFAPYRERQLPNVKLRMKIFSSFHINTQLLMPSWIQNQEIKYNFFFLAPTLDMNNVFEYKLKKVFLLSHNTVRLTRFCDILSKLFSSSTSYREWKPRFNDLFPKKVRFPFLAPYLYANWCFVADFSKKLKKTVILLWNSGIYSFFYGWFF